MVSLNRIRIGWTSTIGIDGVSTFYTQVSPSTAIPQLVNFFVALQPYVPTDVTWSCPSSGTTIDAASGQNIAAWVAPTTAPFGGLATGSYAKPCGVLVNWNTGLFIGGRALRGKTFVVPATTNSFDTDGNVTAACKTALTNAGNTLASSAAQLEVYSTSTRQHGIITTAAVPTKAVVLRSRRD